MPTRRTRLLSNALALAGVAALLPLHAACKRASVERPQPAIVSVSGARAAVPRSARLERLSAARCNERAELGCDVRDSGCQARLFELSRCLSGRDGERPPLRFVSQVQSQREQLEHRARVSSRRAALERAVHALGLGQAPELSVESQAHASGGAYYAPQRRAVYLVSDDAAPEAAELTGLALVHEYVHALQDSRGQLRSALDQADARTFDQELALRSQLEGEATLYEEVARRFARHLGPDHDVAALFAARTPGTDAAIVRQRRPLEASLATFPYTYGAYWAALEDGPPGSSHELLAKRYGLAAPPSPACVAEAALSARGDHDTLGAWFVQTYVRRLTGDAERARAAGRRWRGDWISLGGAPSSPGFVWQTCWDSADTAREMRGLIETQLRGSPHGSAAVTSDGPRVTARLSSTP